MTLVEAILFALDAGGKIIRAAYEALDGKITPDELLARVAAVSKSARDVDARVDAAIEEKFGKKGGGDAGGAP
jgi:hypothetical protein